MTHLYAAFIARGPHRLVKYLQLKPFASRADIEHALSLRTNSDQLLAWTAHPVRDEWRSGQH
jgi:hypothetical protein